MKNIALICALPVLSNSGMISVDLSFETVSRVLPDSNVVRFCAAELTIPGSRPVHYTKFDDVAQLEDFDLIIYWGDFMQWIKYGSEYIGISNITQSAVENVASIEEIKKQTLNNWYKLYLLEGRPDLQKKTIVFGSTLCGLDSAQLQNDRYKTALTSLYKNCKLVAMRDIVSAHFDAQLLQQPNTYYGVDCALLLDLSLHPSTPPVTNPSNQSDYFVYSFGRAKLNSELEKLCLDIAARLGVTAVKIPWLDASQTSDRVLTNLVTIKNAKFAITDIYHLAVNAWREHTPTLTFGRGAAYASQGTLPDKKKEIFNTQIFAMNYYQYLENFELNYLKSSSPELYVANCIKKIVKQDPAYILETIDAQKTRALAVLMNSINS